MIEITVLEKIKALIKMDRYYRLAIKTLDKANKVLNKENIEEALILRDIALKYEKLAKLSDWIKEGRS